MSRRPTGYSLERIETTASGFHFSLVVPEVSALFVGHFPDNPILPGVAQVQICVDALGRSLGRELRLAEVEFVRYRKPVRPGSRCTLTLEVEGERVDFAFRDEAGPVTDGRLRLLEAAHG